MTGESGVRPRLTRRTPAAPVRIVHIGIGAFHRAHQAWWTDVVDPERAWGIAGFTGRTPDVADRLTPQDGLYTLVERGPDSDVATVVESLVEAVDGAQLDRLVELIAASTTAIVTLTVTESGYGLDGDGKPIGDPDNLAATVAGRLVLGLDTRRAAGSGPIAIVPCDNIPDNGRWLASGIRALAETVRPGLGAWIDKHVSFVSTSVDRITPRTRDDDHLVAERLTGFADASPVVTEPFRDWVLSGAFPAGRPRWEDAGARFVDDIEPFERRKLWLLNGAHTLLAYAGQLRGHTTVAEAITNPTCAAEVEAFWDEACAHLDPVALGLDDYRAALLKRFGNARIEHRLEQIGSEGVTKLRVRTVPVLVAELAAGRSGAGALRTIAAWVELLHRNGPLPDAHAREIESALAAPTNARTAALLRVLNPRLATDVIVARVDAHCW